MANRSENLSVKVQERIMALGILVVSLYLMYLSMGFPFESRVFPVAVLGLMSILAVSLVVSSFKQEPGEKEADLTKPFFTNRPRFFAAFACVFGYIFLLPKLGYFTTSALFFIVLTKLLGYRKNKTLVLTVFLFLSFVYLVFILLFERPIPPEFFQAQ